MNPVEQSTSDHALAFTENEAFRQQALIANLWVILFTILVSACLSEGASDEDKSRQEFPAAGTPNLLRRPLLLGILGATCRSSEVSRKLRNRA